MLVFQGPRSGQYYDYRTQGVGKVTITVTKRWAKLRFQGPRGWATLRQGPIGWAKLRQGPIGWAKLRFQGPKGRAKLQTHGQEGGKSYDYVAQGVGNVTITVTKGWAKLRIRGPGSGHRKYECQWE